MTALAARRLGVVGTLVWDRIHHPTAAGGVVEQWGGIAYSLHALAAALPEGWSYEPILKIGDDLSAPARRYLGRLPGIDLGAAFRVVPEPTNRVELVYHDASHRGEKLTGGVPGWSWEELSAVLPRFDALYLNFISGFELDLDTALRLRSAFAGPIYADLHSLFLGCPGRSPREQRMLPRWREWIACFDAIQLNRDELTLLAEGREPEPFLAHLLECGPTLVAATLGSEGVAIAARGGRLLELGEGERLSLREPVPHGPLIGDPTGCGDVWGASFFAGLLAGEPVDTAAQRAQTLAGRKILAPSTEYLFRQLAQPEIAAG